MGLLLDGLNSLMRYYLNNFTDGARQDAMDLFYGHYTVQLDGLSPFIYHFDKQLLIAPIIMLVSCLLILYNVFLSSATFWTRSLWIATFLIVSTFSSMLIIQNGIHYVQYPRLRPPPVLIRSKPLLSIMENRRRPGPIDPSRKVHVI